MGRSPCTDRLSREPAPPAALALSLCSWESPEGRWAPGGGEGHRAPTFRERERGLFRGLFPARGTVLRPAQWVYEVGLGGTDTIHSGGELPFLEQPPGFGRGFRVELVELR